MSEFGKSAEAEPLLVKSYQGYRETLGMEHESTQSALSTLIDYYESKEMKAKAGELRAMLVEF